jgi:hypothetical protein
VRDHPLAAAALFVAVGSGAGYTAAVWLSDEPSSETLFNAATTLLFVGFAGGCLKLLLDDVQNRRNELAKRRQDDDAATAARAQFLRNVLDDLKAVYDEVERVRILIDAHRSAKTYGDQMRDHVIPAAVRLRNVKRALDAGTSEIQPGRLKVLRRAVASMESYLNALVEEFQQEYKRIADRQRVFEATFDRVLEEAKLVGAGLRNAQSQDLAAPPNPAWNELEKLPTLKEFRGGSVSVEAGDGTLGYKPDFTDPLDLASWVLRAELLRLHGRVVPDIPADLKGTRDRFDPVQRPA